MERNHVSDPDPSKQSLLTPKQTGSTTTPPAGSASSEMPSMFNNAQNTVITGGSFNITTSSIVVTGQPLDVLFKRVAPNAILNAGGRADEVKCHPGTREEVIDRIEKWGNAQIGATPPVFWLSGPAGAGKSAIVQTVAERCEQRKIPQANFFFFRADSSRSNASPLIATLVYQIIALHPSLRDPIATLLSADPLILDSALENQLNKLVIIPLRALAQSASGYRPLLLLIDGLDECDSEDKHSQRQILRSFDKILEQNFCPVRLLVASRDESQIQAAFNKMSSQFVDLYLDNQYSPERDIRLFVNAQFEQVKRLHPLAHTLNPSWPLVEDVDYIVEKSSGQFVFSATVMRFISDSAASPLVSLERVKGAAQLATKSPFSHLDAIYTYILSQADDQEALKDILHTVQSIKNVSRNLREALSPLLYSTTTLLLEFLELFNQRYTNTMILSCLADITPIARYDSFSSTLLFYHASFPDYLLAKYRSGDYSLDMAAFHYKVLPIIWKRLINKGQFNERWLQFGLYGMTELQKLPPHLMRTVAMTNFLMNPAYQPSSADFFETVYNLCDSDDDVKHFRHFFYNWVNSRGDEVFETIRDDFFNSIKDKPFGSRYYYMAHGNRHDPPDSKMLAALHPETDFDRHELSLWLRDSVFSRHKKKWPNNTKGYRRLLKSWIPWAVENNIPCDVFKDLPDAQQYIQKSARKKWTKRLFQFEIGSSG